MSFKVLLHPKAAEFLEKAEAQLRDRIKERLRELKDEPEERGQRLRYSPFWRLRIGDYRAIYMIDRERRQVVVLFIGHRRDVYDDFSRLI